MDVPSHERSAAPVFASDESRFPGFGIAGGLLLFVVVTGFAVWLLPFGIAAQAGLLLHVGVGIVGVAVFALWQLRHWLAEREHPRTLRKICAYTGFWLLVASAVSGFLESWQALFGRYVSSIWDSLHWWTSLGALPFLALHAWPAERSQASVDGAALRTWRWRSWSTAVAVTVALSVAGGVLTAYYARIQNAERARQRAGRSDFTPSMVDTEDGRPIAVEALANSDSCGTSDCHAGIYREWKSSAHRWAAEDEFFQEVRAVTTRVKGARETEKCGACHDPVAMLSGHKDPALGRASPGFSEGDSCVICHAIRKVDERGIGSYVLGPPSPYLYEWPTTPLGVKLNHFLIRSYPAQHNRDFDLALPRKAESCAPCHKEYDVLDEREGPVQVETQFDDWKQGKWNTNPDLSRRLYCQQCHMHLVSTTRAEADPYDLKTEHGSRHHYHAFAAANQYMPGALKVPDSATHLERVHEWLRGERLVADIERVWPRGPIVELKIQAPATARAGERVRVKVTLTNNKVGHGFPTGPLNIARAWIEVVAENAAGRRVFHSGLVDEQNHIEAGSYILKPLAINSAGDMIMKTDLWHPVGPIYRRAVLAGESDTYDYDFKAPPGEVTVTARLRYSKANQFFMDAVYPQARREAPVTDISSAQARIAVQP